MIYPWLKALHIAAAVVWVGGMLIMAVAISILSVADRPRSAEALRAVQAIRRWNRLVTSPAMLLLFVLGTAMAVEGGLYLVPWFHLKLAILIALSALHGVQSASLRRTERNAGGTTPAYLSWSAPVILLALPVITVLAVLKPF